MINETCLESRQISKIWSSNCPKSNWFVYKQHTWRELIIEDVILYCGNCNLRFVFCKLNFLFLDQFNYQFVSIIIWQRDAIYWFNLILKWVQCYFSLGHLFNDFALFSFCTFKHTDFNLAFKNWQHDQANFSLVLYFSDHFPLFLWYDLCKTASCKVVMLVFSTNLST